MRASRGPMNICDLILVQGIATSLAKDCIIARVKYTGARDSVVISSAEEEDMFEDNSDEGELWDLLRPLEGDCTIKFFKFEDPEVSSHMAHHC